MKQSPDEQLPEEPGIDVLGLLREHAVPALRLAGLVAAVVLIAGAVNYFLQPVRSVASLEFRPVFQGAEGGRYPNGLVFSHTDIVAGQVLDVVYDQNAIKDFCARETFRSGFYVERYSDRSADLDAEFRAALSQERLTTVDRERIQSEYQARRAALPLQFRLVFIIPNGCSGLPRVVVDKLLDSVLVTWADQSERQRGVLRHQIEILTPSMLDQEGPKTSRLLRADLVRTSLGRVLANIRDVRQIEGSAAVRLGDSNLTLSEIAVKLTDLVHAQLEPLIWSSGAAMGGGTLVEERLRSAQRQLATAQAREASLVRALYDYSGLAPQRTQDQKVQGGAGQAGTEGLTLQLDRGFLDRLMESSAVNTAANTAFRRDLTERALTLSNSVVSAQEEVSYYQRLQASTARPGPGGRSLAEIDDQLESIVASGKALIVQFNAIFDEMCKAALRTPGYLYQVEKPSTFETYRNYGWRQVFAWVMGAFAVTLLAVFAVRAARTQFSA